MCQTRIGEMRLIQPNCSILLVRFTINDRRCANTISLRRAAAHSSCAYSVPHHAAFTEKSVTGIVRSFRALHMQQAVDDWVSILKQAESHGQSPRNMIGAARCLRGFPAWESLHASASANGISRWSRVGYAPAAKQRKLQPRTIHIASNVWAPLHPQSQSADFGRITAQCLFQDPTRAPHKISKMLSCPVWNGAVSPQTDKGTTPGPSRLHLVLTRQLSNLSTIAGAIVRRTASENSSCTPSHSWGRAIGISRCTCLAASESQQGIDA